VIRVRLLACTRNFLRDDSGQATLEYILILSASVLGAAAISRAIINALDKGILYLGAQLEKDLRTGRVPVDVWKN
jgi:Flp pilus assembly pilin Flp